MARIDEVLSGEKSWGKYALDVLGHTGLGVAYSLPFVAAGVVWLDWGFGLSMAVGEPVAVIGGALREWLQWRKADYEPEKLNLLDRVLDTVHHVIGPPIAFGLVKLVLDLVT